MVTLVNAVVYCITNLKYLPHTFSEYLMTVNVLHPICFVLQIYTLFHHGDITIIMLILHIFKMPRFNVFLPLPPSFLPSLSPSLIHLCNFIVSSPFVFVFVLINHAMRFFIPPPNSLCMHAPSLLIRHPPLRLSIMHSMHIKITHPCFWPFFPL